MAKSQHIKESKIAKHQTKKNSFSIKKTIASQKAYLKMIAIFCLVVIVYYLSVLIFSDNFFAWYINFTAQISTLLINIFGGNSHAVASKIIAPEYSISLSFGCEGTEPIILFIAAVLAFPKKFRLKYPGLILGSLTLFALNIIRIAALFFIGRSYPGAVETFHVVIFPIIFIILAIITWGIWVRWAIVRSKKSL